MLCPILKVEFDMARKVSTRRSYAPIPVVIGAGITEQWYFKHIQDIFNAKIRVRPRYFGTEEIHKLDKKISQVVNEGAIAICVFDADTAVNNESIRKKLEALKAKYSGKKNVILCDSLPSIEYWFLLHYADTNKLFANSHAAELVLRHFIPQYEKTELFFKAQKWVTDMMSEGKLGIAVERAKLYEDLGGSYSRVYKAIEAIIPQELIHQSVKK